MAIFDKYGVDELMLLAGGASGPVRLSLSQADAFRAIGVTPPNKMPMDGLGRIHGVTNSNTAFAPATGAGNTI